MTNGNELLKEMEFKQRIERMKDRELSEFTALQVWDIQGRVSRLEKRKRFTVGASGGIGAAAGAALAFLIDWARRG